MDRPLEDALAELADPVRRVDVEVAEQVDEQEGEPEAGNDRFRSTSP
jgi:hypothetical protein